MTFSTFYAVGTVSVAAKGTAVTGVNTNWAGNVSAGDIFWSASGLSVRIASVDSATKLTLARPWPGAALNASAYEVWQVLDAVGYQRATRDLLRGLSEGALPPLSALVPETNTLPYFDGPGSASKTPLTAFAKTLLDDANAAQALATLGVSTFAKTLLDDADASDALTTLGVSNFAKTLLDDANAAQALATLGFSFTTNNDFRLVIPTNVTTAGAGSKILIQAWSAVVTDGNARLSYPVSYVGNRLPIVLGIAHHLNENSNLGYVLSVDRVDFTTFAARGRSVFTGGVSPAVFTANFLSIGFTV